MSSQSSQSSDQPSDDELDIKEQRRLKRLQQLALAREKALETKRRRFAPKKEMKVLEAQIKERLYQEDLKRVEQLRELAERDPVPKSKEVAKPHQTSPRMPVKPDEQRLDDLINILYS